MNREGWLGRLKWTALGLFLLLMLAACGQSGGEESGHAHRAPNGDLREETASAQALPSFLSQQPSQTRLAYQAAASFHETLQRIPCYCGCGETAGHRSNLNCFIHEIREDGSVVWDDHGTRCGVCVTIALQSAQLKSEGKSDLEIRRFIDSAYREGYAEPTDTALPQ